VQHEEQLIEYLSKEIETHTNSLTTFRSQVNLTVFVGPFVLLGSVVVASKGLPTGLTFDVWTGLALGGLGLSYLVMGFICARIEKHVWIQCNHWRRLIARTVQSAPVDLPEEQLVFRETLLSAYFTVYAAMLVAFVSAVFLVPRMTFAIIGD
jgi:hypothetical protein